MTPEEKIAFLDAIQHLEDRQKLTLEHFSWKLLEGTRYSSGMDLLSETVDRILQGTRKPKPHIPLGQFLHEAMRSVASVDTRNPKRRPISYEEWMEAGPDSLRDTDSEFACSPEELLMKQQEQSARRKTIEAAKSRLAHNKDAVAVFRGLAQEMTPAEIRKSFGLTEKAYKAARAQITKEIRSHGLGPLR